MTSKEKAEELVLKHLRIKTDNVWWNKVPAKQCALIAAKEIYKLDLIPGQYSDDCKNKTSYFSYWEEVMEELEKL